MRMFVAVVPPPEVVRDLDEFLDVRREAAPFRWTSADRLHVTLAFFPEVPDSRLDDLMERLGAATLRSTPFRATITGGGAFPDPARGKVLYVGLSLAGTAGDELDRLARRARTAAATSGIVVDGQRFRPHLTLARCGRPTELSSWVRLLDAYRGPEWTIDAVNLFASHLGEGPRRQPRHEIVDVLALG